MIVKLEDNGINMYKLKSNSTEVRVYTDAKEYEKAFFDELDKENIPISSGFACISENWIAVYVGKNDQLDELLEIVAHELGHIIYGGYEDHEEKAEHYQEFTMDAYNLALEILKRC